MKELKCSCCKKDKAVDYFWKNSSTKRGYSYLCKDCMNEHYKGRNTEQYNTWARNYRMKEESKEYERNFRKKYLCSLNGQSSKLLSNAKARAKKKGLPIDIDLEWVKSELSKMECAVTKIPLVFNKYSDRGVRVSPNSPSLDRINSDKGYTKDNTRVVCWIYNLCKADYTDEDVLTMAKSLVSVTL